MQNNRVIFFSEHDMSCYHYLQMATPVIDSYVPNKVYEDVNDVMELYHITLFVENGMSLKEWNNTQRGKIAEMRTSVIAYFGKLQKKDISAAVSLLEHYYEQTFWDIIENFDYLNLVDANVLNAIAIKDFSHFDHILKCKRIVEKNGKALATILSKETICVEWLLDTYAAEHKDKDYRTMYFPAELTLEERRKMVENYLDSDAPNINYVRLACVVKDSKNLKLTPKIILKAKRLERKLNDDILTSGSAVPLKFTVELDSNRNSEIKKVKYDDDKTPILCYGTRFMEACTNPAIIHYCKEIFEFTDRFSFINLISKESEADVFERIIGFQAKDAYNVNFGFRYNTNMSMLQIVSLQSVLEKKERSIEDSIMDFYTKYLPKTYKYPKLSLVMPTKSASYAEKATTLLTAIESILRQYDLFTKEGAVDMELLAQSKPNHIFKANSAVTNKYYVTENIPNDLSLIYYLLFSDQSMLSYVDPYKDEHIKNFYELIVTKKDVRYDSYEEHQKPRLNHLIGEKIVHVTEDGKIEFINMVYVNMLHHLYRFGAVPYWYGLSQSAPVIEDFKRRGWVQEQNTLLTPEEYRYFSYWLNNELFTNGPALRNHYVHGDTALYDDNAHKNNYYNILILIVLLLIKIEEDLWLKKSVENIQRQVSLRPIGEIAKVLTTSQFEKDYEVKDFVGIPRKFGTKDGYAIVNNRHYAAQGYAIAPQEKYIATYIAFVFNSGVVRSSIERHVGVGKPLNVSLLKSILIPIVEIPRQMVCSTLETMLLVCYLNDADDKYKRAKLQILTELRDYICIELYAPEKLNSRDVRILDNWQQLVENTPQEGDANQLLNDIYENLLVPGNAVMDNVKKARMIVKEISESVDTL